MYFTLIQACQYLDAFALIKEGDLPRIFEQFYTTDPARKGSGNGLGLAISKRIIEAHQGSIIASSTSNQGATFTIHLPIIRNS